nr:hypothetical protein [Tanacetum cinerariifolium]
GARIGGEHGFDQSILGTVLGQIHGLTIVALRLPFRIETNNHHGDVGGACDGCSFLEAIDGVFFLVTDAAAAIVVAAADDGNF